MDFLISDREKNNSKQKILLLFFFLCFQKQDDQLVFFQKQKYTESTSGTVTVNNISILWEALLKQSLE